MLSPFSCGFFRHEDVLDEPVSISSPCSTPRRSTRRRSSKDSKNPYSSLGLDKFSALRAELEERRRKIYAETPSQDISFVRFVYKDLNDTAPVPIVIKLKGKKEDHNNNNKTPKHDQHQVLVKERHVTALAKFTNEPSTPTEQVSQQPKTTERVFLSGNFSDLGMWRRPSYYFLVVVVFILVLLAVFGRSVAIVCASICWYALPTLEESSLLNNNTRSRASKKKDHVSRISDNNKEATYDHHGLSSPKSNATAGTPRSHGQRKSW